MFNRLPTHQIPDSPIKWGVKSKNGQASGTAPGKSSDSGISGRVFPGLVQRNRAAYFDDRIANCRSVRPHSVLSLLIVIHAIPSNICDASRATSVSRLLTRPEIRHVVVKLLECPEAL
jgi:hypothetical protein